MSRRDTPRHNPSGAEGEVAETEGGGGCNRSRSACPSIHLPTCLPTHLVTYPPLSYPTLHHPTRYLRNLSRCLRDSPTQTVLPSWGDLGYETVQPPEGPLP